MNELNLLNEIVEIIDIAKSLKLTLFEQGADLDYFSYGGSKADKVMFVDCKIEQQDALDYTKDILRLLKSLESNLKDN